MGFINSKVDSFILLNFIGAYVVLILVYVDDILITGSNNSVIKKLVLDLRLNFALKDLGLFHYFLGVEVINSNNSMHLSQQKFIRTT